VPNTPLNSAAWYDRHPQDYIARTQAVDLSPLYAKFLAHVPPGGRILDAGCGSGRDSLAFRGMGYEVVPMDASLAMVEHVTEVLDQEALHLRHQDVAFVEAFNGIWSNASLLHVPHAELPDVLQRYGRALAPGGVLFASFKLGEGEDVRSERLFANQNETSFRAVVGRVAGLELLETWTEADRRPGRQDEQWFSVLCRRSDVR
jgi:SAM-dependent methyltransferase